MKPPQPKKVRKIHIAHGDERIDDYYWLRDDTRKNPDFYEYRLSANSSHQSVHHHEQCEFFELSLVEEVSFN